MDEEAITGTYRAKEVECLQHTYMTEKFLIVTTEYHEPSCLAFTADVLRDNEQKEQIGYRIYEDTYAGLLIEAGAMIARYVERKRRGE